MEDLTRRICWEFVKKEGYIAIWRKTLNNSCYLNRQPEVRPPLCDTNDDPDNVWYSPIYPFKFATLHGKCIYNLFEQCYVWTSLTFAFYF